MNRNEKIELLKYLEEKERRQLERMFYSYFPDEGPLRRELYPKHLEFFCAGGTHFERLMLAANRIGKTESIGGYESAAHATGRYPTWWNGRKWDRPTFGWVGGDNKETVRDITQLKLLGPLHNVGTGLIPKADIIDLSRRPGIPGVIDTAFIRHQSGGVSEIGFKSYDQGRHSWQGTKKDFVWLDEEPPLDVYTEALLRLTSTTGNPADNGSMILTFTPLKGMSETVMAFLPAGQLKEVQDGTKYVVTATWDDVPHLDEATKKILWESIPPFQRDARSKGVPQLGSGAIYPVPESDFVVDPFEIPKEWPKVYGMDVGWNRTAVVWGAWDRDKDIVYLNHEHYRGQAEPVIHAQGIKAAGDWIPGVIDPASRGRNQKDGFQLIEVYRDLGLDLEVAFNGVDSGLYEVWQRLSTGRLKVFRSLSNWLYEFRLYRRDDKGRIVKENDHLMDATRYLVMSGLERAKTKPVEKPKVNYDSSGYGGGWMG